MLVLLALPATLLLTSQAAAELVARSQVERTQLIAGEAAQWIVRLEGSGMTVPEPEFANPTWARVNLRGTERQFSLIDGKPSSAVIYRFVLVPQTVGRHRIPPVAFHVGRNRVRTEAISVEVLQSAAGLDQPTRGSNRLRVVARVDRNRAVIGEPVRITIRFYQGMRLLGDSHYRAPDVPGFWSESTSTPRSYYTTEAGSRWLVTESFTFLYPTVSGELTIGPARMVCAVPKKREAIADPFSAFALPGTEGEIVEVESKPITISVTQPPASQPLGYDGAVGNLRLALVADRTAIRADETLNLTLRLAGTGNLRIAPQPGWPDLHDFEIYSHGSEDSLDLEGSIPTGTKRIELALLPRRQGDLEIPPIEYAIYDPASGYRVLRTGAISVTVGPPLAAVAGATGINPLDVPRGVYRPPQPWLGWVVLLLGLGLVFITLAWLIGRLRSRQRRAEEGHIRELRSHLDTARRGGQTADYLRLAEEWLASEGAVDEAAGEEQKNAARVLLGRVRQARYAAEGGATEIGEISPMLERQLQIAQRGLRASWRFPVAPALALLASLLITLAGGGYAALRLSSSPASLAVADSWQHAGQYFAAGLESDAGDELAGLWREGYRGGPLAAQCAVAALRERRVGGAALWSERARRESPRDPFVRRVRIFLDEEGALPGHPEGLGTILSWRDAGLAAAVLWSLAALAWALSRLVRPAWRWVALGLAGSTVLTLLVTVGVWQSGFANRGAVILDAVSLHNEPDGSPELDLEPGRLVGLREAREQWVRVHLGGGLEGWVPLSSLEEVDRPWTPAASKTAAHP
jgi:hypothetical protein